MNDLVKQIQECPNWPKARKIGKHEWLLTDENGLKLVLSGQAADAFEEGWKSVQ